MVLVGGGAGVVSVAVGGAGVAGGAGGSSDCWLGAKFEEGLVGGSC